jgi:tetratricopeptide (TPR) repeat protein
MARSQAQRRRRARSHARVSARSAEDLMFFPKLRRRAKWVFLLLALAFGIGFLAFGVGTGVPGANIGDIFQDIIGQRGADEGTSIGDARERAQKSPGSAEAQFELVTALQSAGRTREAIAVLERLTARQPNNAEAIEQLAALWGAQAADARDEAESWTLVQQEASIRRIFAPANQSQFVNAISENRVFDGVAELASNHVAEASSRAVDASEAAASAWGRLSRLRPDDASVFLQLGQAALDARDTEGAIDAWERFLELAPDDASAPIVRQQLELLKAQTSG